MTSATLSAVLPSAAAQPTDWRGAAMQKRIAARYRAERRFRMLGLVSLILAGAFLLFLLSSIVSKGWTGFLTTEIRVEVAFDEESLGVSKAELTGPDRAEVLARADTGLLPSNGLEKQFPELTSDEDKVALSELLSSAAAIEVNNALLEDPDLIGQTRTMWLTASTLVDQLMKGKVDRSAEDANRRISEQQIAWADSLKKSGAIRTVFNTRFLTGGDSTEAEQAAVGGGAIGSLLTLIVTLLLSFPIGVCAAVYLEEFAPKNRVTDFIEVNINNLAAVPSIIFGLLGLAIFLQFFGLPRSSPLVGGMTLALMTLPVIVIAARVSIKAVPPSIRDAARGLGASPLQVVFHQVLPLALPGILTGTIIGMARALGETAPLLMIGMRAFVVDVPSSFFDAATVLPVQVFLWSDEVSRGFVEKTSAAIMVLLAFLLMMNGVAIYLRNRFEVRW